MKILLIIAVFTLSALYSCKRQATYDYMVFNKTNAGVVRLKFQTIDLQGNANVSMQLQKDMGMSIYTEKTDGKVGNKEMGNSISVIKNIAVILNDSTKLSINPKQTSNWHFNKVDAHHGVYSLVLEDNSFEE